MVVLCTILGFVAGIILGFSLMCILSANKDTEDYINYIQLKEKYDALVKQKDSGDRSDD